MIKKIVIIIILILFPVAKLNAFDSFSKADYAHEGIYQTLHFVDMLQTRQIAKNERDYYEMNPLLGDHPSKDQVYGYFLITAVGHAGISYLLPRKYREVWQYLTIFIPLICTFNNYGVGIKLSW